METLVRLPLLLPTPFKSCYYLVYQYMSTCMLYIYFAKCMLRLRRGCVSGFTVTNIRDDIMEGDDEYEWDKLDGWEELE